MAEKSELSSLSDYVSVRDAADILDLSEQRIYELVSQQRLVSVKVGGGVGILRSSIDTFTRKAPGRLRTTAPRWRKYRSPTQLTTTEITVKIKKGKEQRLREKLEVIREGNRHTFTGSMARYIMIDPQKPDQ